MASAGQLLEAPGLTLSLLETSAETNGELLVMEAGYTGDGPLPPPHFHPSQDEHFEVLVGRARTVIGGVERVYESGESFDVPARTVHQMGGAGACRVRWEVRPALRTAEFFERLYGALAAGEFSDEERAAFYAEFAAEFRLAEPGDT